MALWISRNLGRSGSHSWLDNSAGEVETLLQLVVHRYYGSQSKPYHNILLHTKATFQHSIGALSNTYLTMASAIAKRKRSSLQDGPRQQKPRTTTAQLQTGSSADEISFNKLCLVCEKIFARFSRERKYTFSWFHDFFDFIESASNGCHSCSLIKAKMRSNGRLTEEDEHELRRIKKKNLT